ncbi:endonuclease III domain-containing protein [Spirosoma aerolatum]|uniref:endonuclease III domain-containing protein n=1 Tax=Spirosoma aerolatum TaxID=1211326 RepID=UPI0009AE4798|nr:endonuclease III [Spirosoma aerolatum]
MQLSSESASKTWIAHERLTLAYGTQAIQGYSDPMHELIGTILSHRTTHANEVLAYRTLRERFPAWEQVRDAPLWELIDAIKSVTYPEVKAPYIKNLLEHLFRETGSANIDFLNNLPTEEAMHWLTSLPGIGLKTATLLLLFKFHKPVLPVDTHVHRVTQRLGLIGPRVSAEKAHTVLLAYLPKEPLVLFNFHKHFYWHGQRICTWYTPRCSECVLKDICDFYQQGGTVILSSTPIRRKNTLNN